MAMRLLAMAVAQAVGMVEDNVELAVAAVAAAEVAGVVVAGIARATEPV
jgi:hypothetical protein